MNWLKTSTVWVFYSGSGNLNYLYDILEGASRLRSRDVKHQSCFFFVPSNFVREINRLGFTQVSDYTQFSQTFVASKIISEQIVFIGTGHGNQFGLTYLDLTTKILRALPPAELISTICAIPGLRQGLILLGQCFAGVFNFLEASNSSEPEICLIGATNFDSSLNFWVDSNQKNIYLNFFLFFFFDWIANPVDIDGDGVCSLLDAYKFAGVNSNQRLHARRQEAYSSLEAIKAKYIGEEDELKKTAFSTEINKHIELIHIHQEPWILNSNLARAIHF
jgi:hypothetical protein